jgi:single-strand DNA-binding protein
MPDLKQPQINFLIISGRLTANPEIKHVGRDNNTVCNVSLATDDGWGDKKKPIFLDCTFWGKSAEIAGKLHKSSPVILEGRIRMEEWEDKNTGGKRSKIAMTVNRIHGLAWEDKKAASSSDPEDTPY